MTTLKSARSDRRQQAGRLGITLVLAAILFVALLWGLRRATPAHADPGVLYVDGATGQDVATCGAADLPCQTISYTLNSRAGSGDTIRVAQGVYTENLTVDKPVALEGGYAPSGTLWLTRTAETVIDGSNSRTVWGDWDGKGIHMSAVISDNGVYNMWYNGWGLTGGGIGLATSPDGITWSKYAGNPVFTATVDWEDGDVGHPHVIKDGATYKMWYGSIGYAESVDGADWTKYANNPILEGTPGTWDEDGVGAPFVVKVGSDDYRMWYHNDELNGIGYATSTNGITWTKHTSPVLSPGSAGAWDDAFVADPNVLFDGVTYHMWYAGYDGDAIRIGYASSSDGINWNKWVSNPLLSYGAPGEWDEFGVGEPNVLFDGALYRMWFSGWRDSWQTPQRGYATSSDGITWTKYVDNPVLSPGTPGQWGRPVVDFVEGSDGSVLDGFTVRNGEAEDGAGIYVAEAQVTVQDCTVTGNRAYDSGGGIRVSGEGADATTRNTSVLSNTAGGNGAGIVVGWDSTAVISDCVIAHNRSLEGEGAGIAVRDDSTATIAGNQVVSNTTGGDGGGIVLGPRATAVIEGNRIRANDTQGGSGGVWINGGSVITLTNNLISSNVGDGVSTNDSRAWLINNTIDANSSEGVFVSLSDVTLQNNIVARNGNCGINTWSGGLPSTATLSYNDFWNNAPDDYCDWGPGPGDISADPLFVDAANGDYHLQAGSPCIDAGTSAGAPALDIEGTPRDATPDMGAYEWAGEFHIFLPLVLRGSG